MRCGVFCQASYRLSTSARVFTMTKCFDSRYAHKFACLEHLDSQKLIQSTSELPRASVVQVAEGSESFPKVWLCCV